ncbi:myosin heavy chain kinase [Tieghemostelium lacteum]|uniref:Myosin heavy chain kinase n=1 Tax=Tieghemostelium lacteum TaxID=361077 RepID=A0A151ZCN5_TIELA|nr:myosin heavy chain kinase [Tieghemostelium lacteum]|eukprot:KYQ91700.1 myosin heavy chain kinase [Tieghemostelium lacteum]
MVVLNVWFSYEDEEVEIPDLTSDTTVSSLRKILHEGKIFHFPYGTSQTDLQIGKISNEKFDKYKARNTLVDIQYKQGDTLVVKLKKSKVATDSSLSPTLNISFLEGGERVIKWEYDPYTTTAQWTCTAILVKMEPVPFAEGAFRKAFHLQDLSKFGASRRYVAKIAKKPTSRDSYFEDVKMQMIAKKWADNYNSLKPPKKIEFLQSCVLEFIDRTGNDIICGAEPYVEGQYRKYNNNSGFVSNDERNTPQSFSHFTYEHSNHQLLIIDIQGVGDHYTDPQIHTYDGTGFGIGNLGKKGFEKFLDTHKCNAICQFLCLSSINPKSEKSDCGTVPRPDLIFPDSVEKETTNNNNNNNTTTTIQVSVNNENINLSNNNYQQNQQPQQSSKERSKSKDQQHQQHQQQHQQQLQQIEKEKQEKEKLEKDRHKKEQQNWDLSSIKLTETLRVSHISSSLCIIDQSLFAGCQDNTIKVYEYRDQILEQTNTLKGHEGPVESICYNDQYIFTGSSDHSIKVWDIKKLKCIFTLEGHEKQVHTVIVNDKYLFSGSSDKTIKVWDLKTLECKYTLEGHARTVKTLVVSGQYLFSGSNDKTIKVWDLKTFRCNYTLKGHTKWVSTICIVGTNLYSGSYDKTIRVWSLKSLECTATLRGHDRWVEHMVNSDKYLFSASDDNTIKVWDLETLKCITSLEGHNATVQCLALWFDKKSLFSSSHDQTIKLWAW